MLRRTVNENAGARTFLSDSCAWDRSSGQEGPRLRNRSVALALFLWLGCGTSVFAGSQLFTWGDLSQTNPIPPNTVAIAAGQFHNLTLNADGYANTWASSLYYPARGGLAGVTRIAAGLEFNLALKADGTVVAWGDNIAGRATVPAGLANVVAIAAGGYHSLALRESGSVAAWGDNSFGQTAVPTLPTNLVALSAGF